MSPAADIQLTDHFTLSELLRSDTAASHGIDNTPNAAQISNLRRLCDGLLEPIRSLLGVPLHVNSGFRCPALNAAVGGQTNPPSAHLDGRAADVLPGGMDLWNAWMVIKASALPYDQLIIETNHSATWLHVAIARDGEVPRREAFPLTKRDARAIS